MAGSLREALREQVTVRAALEWTGVLAVLWYVLDPSTPQFATTVVSLALFGLTELVTDVYDVRQSVRNAGIGLYALVGGAAMLLFDDGTTWLPVAFLLVGAWFVLDAVQTVRHEGATEEEPSGRDVYHDYVGRQVHGAVEDGPRTRRELYEALEADDDAVDASVEKLAARGVVVTEGSSVRLAESETEESSARVAGAIGGLARRIARPVTREFEDEPTERTPADRGRAAGREPAGREPAGETTESDAADREPERESSG